MKAVVVGGSGALGRALVSKLRETSSVQLVVSVGRHTNEEAHRNVAIPHDKVLQEDSFRILEADLLQDGPFDAVFCVSGGWCGGNLFSASLSSDVHEMVESSLFTSILASKLSATLLAGAPAPLLVFSGAQSATGATPSMLAYGVAKAATHHLAISLATDPSAAGLPKSTRIRCLLPSILDTPSNRTAMPSADFDKWTNLDTLSSKLVGWMVDPQADEDKCTFIEV